jgi:hypothetical protein
LLSLLSIPHPVRFARSNIYVLQLLFLTHFLLVLYVTALAPTLSLTLSLPL